MRDKKRLSESEAAHILQQLLHALQFCHRKARKRENTPACRNCLLVTSVPMLKLCPACAGPSHPLQDVVHRDVKLENILIDWRGHVKLIDFGLCGYFVAGKRLRCHCGSPSYAAPEIVVRSWGTVLVACCCCHCPLPLH